MYIWFICDFACIIETKKPYWGKYDVAFWVYSWIWRHLHESFFFPKLRFLTNFMKLLTYIDRFLGNKFCWRWRLRWRCSYIVKFLLFFTFILTRPDFCCRFSSNSAIFCFFTPFWHVLAIIAFSRLLAILTATYLLTTYFLVHLVLYN